MKNIYEYIELPQLDRQQHLDLQDSCLEIGGDSVEFRGLLAHYLKTTIPRGNAIQLCHACHKPGCSNPKHLYWGTISENVQDGYKAGRISPTKGKVPWNKGLRYKLKDLPV